MDVLLSLGCGALVAIMVQFSGELQMFLGPLAALLVLHVVGLLTASGYRRIVPGGGAPGFNPRQAPVWYLSAGMLGIVVVLINMEVFVRGGILLALAGTLAGQTLGAYIVELTPWSRGGQSVWIQRAMVLAFIVPGSVMIGVQSGAEPLWIAAAFVPGFFLIVQSMFNSYNSSRWGHSRMLQFNYVSALLVLIPLNLLRGNLDSEFMAQLGGIPIHVLLGGGVLGVAVVGTITYLLKKTSPVKTFLGLYTGQLGIGVVLDAVQHQSVAPEKLIGVVLVAVGLIAGELKLSLRPRGQRL
ncbi:MAG: DMT family transporter [Spirochaetaceae bacterium]|nr:DMT family transporter [Spirochaetaceae bacterium]MCF7951352.1 DMT family transporter [Spirochaetaceae bacterium]